MTEELRLMKALVDAEKDDPWHDGGQVAQAIEDIRAYVETHQ